MTAPLWVAFAFACAAQVALGVLVWAILGAQRHERVVLHARITDLENRLAAHSWTDYTQLSAVSPFVRDLADDEDDDTPTAAFDAFDLEGRGDA